MKKKRLEAMIVQRVLEKMEQRGLLQVRQRPGLSRAVRDLARFMGADDVGYLNERGQLTLESVGDTANEASRRLAMTIRQVRRGAEDMGLVLEPDLQPTTVRIPEDNLFAAVTTFNVVGIREASTAELDDAGKNAPGEVPARGLASAVKEAHDTRLIKSAIRDAKRGGNWGMVKTALRQFIKDESPSPEIQTRIKRHILPHNFNLYPADGVRLLQDLLRRLESVPEARSVTPGLAKVGIRGSRKKSESIREADFERPEQQVMESIRKCLVSERPFAPLRYAEAHQRQRTLNSFSSGTGPGLTRHTGETKANWRDGSNDSHATYRGFGISVLRQSPDTWQARGKKVGAGGPGSQIFTSQDRELCKDHAETWAKKGGRHGD